MPWQKDPSSRPPPGPLDPPGKIAHTISQITGKKHIGTPRLPPIGFERQFQRKSRLRDGEGDESLEVGVLKYDQGGGIGEVSLLFSGFWVLAETIVSVSVELDTELLVGRDKSWSVCSGYRFSQDKE